MAKGIKTGGRTKGTPNKTTASIKAAIEEAFDKAGGADYLYELAISDPKTFVPLLAKLLPMDVNANHGVTDEFAAFLEKIGTNGRKIHD